MADSLSSKRLSFPRGKQRRFIDRAVQVAGNVEVLSRYLKVCPRTIRDWRREKFLMPSNSARLILERYNIKLPANVSTRDRFWYVAKGAKKGGCASYKAQGGTIGKLEIRKQRWREWWENEGKHRDNILFHPLGFEKPAYSVELAEFLGIMMGDGGMNKYQLSITLHYKDDLEFSIYVVRLIRKLFKIKPHIHHRPKFSVNRIVISRSELIKYLHSLGLPIGNKLKNRLDIPDWVKRDKGFAIACTRGLLDTDGCLIIHRYKVNGKLYTYKKISFTSLSRDLINSVYSIMQNNNLHPRIANKGRDIRIDSIKQVAEYFRIVGSHNPKHWKRYKSLV